MNRPTGLSMEGTVRKIRKKIHDGGGAGGGVGGGGSIGERQQGKGEERTIQIEKKKKKTERGQIRLITVKRKENSKQIEKRPGSKRSHDLR